jgi:hypothetical protein
MDVEYGDVDWIQPAEDANLWLGPFIAMTNRLVSHREDAFFQSCSVAAVHSCAVPLTDADR